MNYEYQVFLFRGQRKHEYIQIGKTVQSLSIGQVICTMLGLSPEFFQSADDLLDTLGLLQRRYLMACRGGAEEDAAEEGLRELKSILQNCSVTDPEEAVLFHVIKKLPCYDAYSEAYAPMMRVLPNSEFLKEYKRESQLQPGESTAQIEYERATAELQKYADQYAAWNSFLLFLNDELEHPYWNIIAKCVFGVEDARESYPERLRACFVEAKRLQRDLRDFLFRNSTESSQLLTDAIPSPRIYCGQASLIGPEYGESGKYSNTYEIVSLSELVRMEINLLDAIGRSVHRCKICEKYFVPYRETENACQRDNPEYHGRKCSFVYSQQAYRANHPEMNSTVGKVYLKRYKAYSKWAAEGMIFVRECVKDIFSNENERRQAISDICGEISRKQEDWRSNGRKIMQAYNTGAISEETAIERINLPSIKERSPLLAAFHKSYSTYQGK